MNSFAHFKYMVTMELIIHQSITFPLYSTQSMVGRGILVLTHSVPDFPPNFLRHCVLSGGIHTPQFCLGVRHDKQTLEGKGIEYITIALQSHLCPCATTASVITRVATLNPTLAGCTVRLSYL